MSAGAESPGATPQDTRPAAAASARLLRASVSYGVLQYVVLVISVVKGVYIAKYLGPALLGSYGLIVLIVEYLRFANLGVYSAMNLEVSTRRHEAGESGVLERVVASAWTYALITGAVFVLVALVIRFWLVAWVPPEVATYLFAICFVGFAGQFRVFSLTYARLQRQYRLINMLELVSSGTVLVVVLLFGATYGLDAVVAGMIVAAALTLGVGVVMAFRAGVVRIDFAWIPSLITIGIPLFLYGVFEHIFGTIDRWVIVTWLSREDLGYYTLSYSFATSSLLVLNAFTYIAYPEFLGKFRLASAHQDETDRVLASVKGQTVTFAGVVVGLGILGMVCVEPVVAWLLPQYERSIGLYRIVMIGMVAQRIAYFAATFLVANRRQVLLMALLALSVPVSAGISLAALRLDWGLEGVAISSAVSLTLYALLTVASALRAVGGLTVANMAGIFGKFAFLAAAIGVLLVAAPGLFYLVLIPYLLIYARENGAMVKTIKARLA